MMTDGPKSCPHEDREGLAEDYLARRLSEEQAEAFEAHYFACDDCFAAVELLAGVHQATRQPAHAPVAARRIPRVFVWAAAAIILIAVPGLWLLRPPGRGVVEAPAMRGAEDGFEVAATRSASALLLQWPPVAGAEHYQVRIASVEGETLWERQTAETRLSVPLDELPAGARARDVYARVEALGGLLQPVARSQIVAVPFPGDKTP